MNRAPHSPSSRPVARAVIPAAGRGSRVRSVAGDYPKEMLLLDGKPMIQWAVEMHIRSGIEEIAVILHPDKEMLRDYLEYGKAPPDLPVDRESTARFLELRRKAGLRFFYQRERRGVVDAVLLAREFVGDQWFALVMPDTLLVGERPFLSQFQDRIPPQAHGVIGFILLDRSRAEGFGNVGLLEVERTDGSLHRIQGLSDKAPGTVRFAEPVRAKGFAGGVYSPAYFDYAFKIKEEDGREVDDVPIHQEMAREGRLFGVLLEGEAFDLGLPEGYREACEYLRAGKREGGEGPVSGP